MRLTPTSPVGIGEVLYIPSFWFHYIVSLDYSVQCNTRSGPPPNHNSEDQIDKCMGGEISEGEIEKTKHWAKYLRSNNAKARTLAQAASVRAATAPD
jgi:hypothetical protein